MQLEGEGTYECSVTGLVFEAAERVLVRYSVLSWSRFSTCLPDSWKFAGPIFNVDTVNKDASALKSIQFPHSICLAGESAAPPGLCSPFNRLILLLPRGRRADPENETKFSVLHVKDSRPLVEPTVDHSGSHVKWNVTSLSPVGPIVQASRSVEHHGVVLVYKQLGGDSNNNHHSFHVYLATNSSSDIKVEPRPARPPYRPIMALLNRVSSRPVDQDISKQVRGYKNRYIRIEKPPTCKLEEGAYRLISEPEGEIRPQVRLLPEVHETVGRLVP